MKTSRISCPNCKIKISISNLPEKQEEWNSLQFTCSNCNHRIGLINTIQDSNRPTMKKIKFEENCSNSNCNKINTIYALESSIGNTIKNKCFNCKTMMIVTVPDVNDASNGNAVTNKTKVGSVNQTEKKLSLLVLDSENNKEQYFEISQPFLTIGRKNNTAIQPDIAIETEDTNMSRVHALIKRNDKNNTFSIQDNGSLNHTFINEEVLKTSEDKSKNEIVVLKNKDKIRLGKTIIQITIQ